ncbi:MAG TPA: ABC transporter permease subunit [Candidatus Limnocylindria bacterium]|nr:ABC transporter permease subunit [Candidatus Limnocylindria bacterium]
MTRFLARAWPFVLLLALWQLWVTAAHVPSIVAPTPRAVGLALVTHPQLYLGETAVTLGVALAGLVIGTALALVFAIATWFSPLLTSAVTFPALLVQATPIVALMPVLARLLGYDQRTVVAAAALITVFPTFVLVAAGLRAPPPGAPDLFAVLGASRLACLRLLALPAAVPNFAAALRIASANCIVAALIAEYLMGTSGLGRLFATAEGTFDTAGAWAASLVATALSVAGYLATRRFERYVGRRFRP